MKKLTLAFPIALLVLVTTIGTSQAMQQKSQLVSSAMSEAVASESSVLLAMPPQAPAPAVVQSKSASTQASLDDDGSKRHAEIFARLRARHSAESKAILIGQILNMGCEACVECLLAGGALACGCCSASTGTVALAHHMDAMDPSEYGYAFGLGAGLRDPQTTDTYFCGALSVASALCSVYSARELYKFRKDKEARQKEQKEKLEYAMRHTEEESKKDR